MKKCAAAILSLLTVLFGLATISLAQYTTYTSPDGDFRAEIPAGWKIDVEKEGNDYRSITFTDPARPNYPLVVRWFANFTTHRMPDGILEMYSGDEDYTRQTVENAYGKNNLIKPVTKVSVQGRAIIQFAARVQKRDLYNFRTVFFAKLREAKSPAEVGAPGTHFYTVVSSASGFYSLIHALPPEAGALDERYYRRLVNSFVLLKNCPACKPLEQAYALAGMTTAESAEKGPEKPLNPREQFQQYLGKLQQDPDDPALREKIIKLALTLEPKPAIPEEAEKLVGRATFIFKNAKTEADYVDAVQAYQRALLITPWVADYYFNLAVAQERAGKPSDAIASLKFYLMAAPDAQDRRDVLQRIGGLEYAAEKVQKETSPAALATKQREKDEQLIKGLNGVVYGAPNVYDAYLKIDREIQILGNRAVERNVVVYISPEFRKLNPGHRYLGNPVLNETNYSISGREFAVGESKWVMSEDGNFIALKDREGKELWRLQRKK